MSLSNIESYVNAIITVNRDKDFVAISTFFDVMNKRSEEILEKIKLSKQLDEVLNEVKFKDNTILTGAEKEIITEAVKYILDNTNNICESINIIESTGLLDTTFKKVTRFNFLFKLDVLLNHASELYFDNVDYWKTVFQKKKHKDYFINKFYSDKIDSKIHTNAIV